MRGLWETATLNDVCEVITDGSHWSPPSTAVGLPMASVKDLTPYGVDASGCRMISETDFARLVREGCQPHRYDVLIAKDGATALDTVCLVEENPEFVVLSSIAILRPDARRVLPGFLRYYLDAPQTRAYMKGAFATGAAIPRVVLRDFKRVQIEVPPQPTQRKIAAILAAYDDLIENSIRRIELLEEMAQRIYREWFVDFRFPGHENRPLVTSELGPIPAGWSVRTIAEVATRERYAVTSGPFGSKLGGKDYVTNGVPVIRGNNLAVGGDFRDSEFVFVSSEKADDLKSCLARPGDVVVTQRGTLGQVGLIPEKAKYERYVLSQSQMKITVDPSHGGNQYLYMAMRSPEVTKRMQGRAMTAGVPHINLSILRQFNVIWPDAAVQAEAAETIGLFLRQVVSLKQVLECLRATRDLLLPRLIGGVVDVTDVPVAISDAAA